MDQRFHLRSTTSRRNHVTSCDAYAYTTRDREISYPKTSWTITQQCHIKCERTIRGNMRRKTFRAICNRNERGYTQTLTEYHIQQAQHQVNLHPYSGVNVILQRSPTDIRGNARSNPLTTWLMPSTNSTQGRPRTCFVDIMTCPQQDDDEEEDEEEEERAC